MSSARGIVNTIRSVVHRVPFLGHGLRYSKRLVMMPWNFHKIVQAWSNDPPANAARVSSWEAAGATQHVVNTAAHRTTHDVVKTVVTWSEWNSKSIEHVAHAVGGVNQHVGQLSGNMSQLTGHVNQLRTNVKQDLTVAIKTATTDIGIEIQKLNETHATCYDQLVACLRELVAQQQAGPTKQEFETLKATLATVEKQLESLTRQLAASKGGETNGKDSHHMRRVA